MGFLCGIGFWFGHNSSCYICLGGPRWGRIGYGDAVICFGAGTGLGEVVAHKGLEGIAKRGGTGEASLLPTGDFPVQLGYKFQYLLVLFLFSYGPGV